MNDTPDIATANEDMVKYWNSASTAGWIDEQETMDFTLAAVADEIIARADPQAGERVIEIGCGTGATSLRLAQCVGPQGSLLGVDISAPMLGLARERAAAAGFAHASFELADAQVHPFAEAGADLLVSRFGVMFFADPVAAFANMRSALKPGGRMLFAAWAPLEDNPWLHAPTVAAVDRLGRPDPVPPRAPGPFAFADHGYILGIVEQAGFANAAVDVVDLLLTAQGDLDAVAGRAVVIGPASRIIRAFDGGTEDKAAIVAAVRTAFAPFDGPDGVRVPAKLHMISGTRPR